MGATIRPHLLDAVWTSGNYIEEHYDPENGIKVENGYFTVPSDHGLGINPDVERIGSLKMTYS